LGEATLVMKKPFLSSEIHGMAVRGGSVVSHIKIGKFKSPLIRAGQADIIFALSSDEMARYKSYLKIEGSTFINTTSLGKEGHCDALSLAIKAGSNKALNLSLLGYALATKDFPFSYSVIKNAIEKITPTELLHVNLKALQLGYSYVKIA
jgi:indolepyruvate ferredoxin oxidoreductase beta subunit